MPRPTGKPRLAGRGGCGCCSAVFPACTPHQVSPHVWWFTPESRRDRPSLAVVVGSRETLLLDVGASPAHLGEFMSALDVAGVRRPVRAVLTHWHWDHVFGLGGFQGEVIAQRGTADQLARMCTYDYSDAGLPALLADGREIPFTCEHIQRELSDTQRRGLKLRVPEVVFDDGMQLDLGGVECELRHVGGDHAPDSVVIHVPADRLLFMGDCLCEEVYTPPRRFTRGRLLPLVAHLEEFAAEIHLMGHAEEPISGVEMRRWLHFIRDAYAALDQAGIDAAGRIRADLLARHGEATTGDLWPGILAGYRNPQVAD